VKERRGSRPLAPVRVTRTTAETNVSVSFRAAIGDAPHVEIALDEPLVAHAVATFATWARIDLKLRAKGDLDHHVVEDAALVLGRAIRTSLGDVPRHRIGDAIVPMDDALVQVVLDLAHRPHYERSGELPPLFDHFLRTLATEAQWTLHVRVLSGHESHHLAEAAAKALALAFLAAAKPYTGLRSRKGAPDWTVEPAW
jgi:imidazoleglycerol-phosphate dehydratase